MLVIRRHPGQAIQIGEDVEVLVIDCGNGRVKLGIRAPQRVVVARGEVARTRRQNVEAAAAITRELSWADASASFLPGGLQSFEDAADKKQ